MRAHRDGELHEQVHGPAHERRVEAEQRGEQRRAIRQARRLFVDDLDLVAFEHGDVDELPRFFAAVMLDDEQSGRRDFDHDAQRRNRARRAPHRQIAIVAAPDAQMNAGALNRGREATSAAGSSGSGRANISGCAVSSGARNASEIFGT